MTDELLKVEHLTKRFGGVLANDDISFSIAPGELVSVIGPNGAGKSTLFRIVCGVKPTRHAAGPDKGRVMFDGQDITGWPAHRVCRAGLALVFQETESLKEMTAVENVAIGALVRCDSFHEAQDKAAEILQRVELGHRASNLVSDLTLAERRRLEIGRALATQPKLLLLDETMAGLTPTEVNDAVGLVRRIAGEGVTVMLIEHVLQAVMAVSDRIIVLDAGAIIADGPPSEVVENPDVIRAYLGGEVDNA